MAWFSWQQAKQLDPSLNALDGFFTEPPVKVQTVTGGSPTVVGGWNLLKALHTSGDRPVMSARLFQFLVTVNIKC